ncbi:cobalt-precorrin-6A reductase [Pseudoroseomonas rhizosphaerae]|uniref:Cobalt-precorrin-6A reductase n=1 Tax=Teichococcus rhizosphaerae TaxID=1335062 RepID=A0A2C6Y0G8_9PROT|nr:cobalt-precorrin-6A reductase [Pseudoroseomonas rhizosphaerae]PHK94282.1 cobalt-precorrin-6A reductase [Pseudoroseomonas rhizosphaerae]
MRVLLLGGTTEARALARSLAGDARFRATLSLAGATRAPLAQPLPARMGGFGGVEGLAAFLRAEGIGALVDATHPFAARMTRNAAGAAAVAGVKLLRVARPAWRPGPGDNWAEFPDMAAIAAALGETPRRVWLTVGQKELAPFRAAPWHRYLIRSVDPPAPESLPPQATVITATGPFALDGERALLREHRIEVLVSKNSGGTATQAKLLAAREAGLPVLLLARPPDPPGLATVPDAASALAWLHGLLAERGA